MISTTHRIEVANLSIAYDTYDGGGLPVVLLHASGASRAYWRRAAEDMGRNGLSVFVPDLPGHGDSARLEDGRYDPPFFARIITELVARVAATEGLLVGHSLGGHLALEALADLDALRGVVLSGAPPLRTPADAATAFLPVPVSALLFKEVLDDREIETWSHAFPPADPGLIRRDLLRADGRVRSAMGAAIAAGQLVDEVSALRRSRCRTLLIHGSADQLVSLAFLRALDLNSVRGELAILEGAGHFAPVDRPGAFADLVVRFASTI